MDYVGYVILRTQIPLEFKSYYLSKHVFTSKGQDLFSLQKYKFDPRKEFNFDTLYYELVYTTYILPLIKTNIQLSVLK